MNKTTPNSRGKILFADDDSLVRDGLAELLRRRGFVCVCASTGVEALEHLRAAEFDALLSDIHMPGNAGLELIAAVPQIAAGLPVVLLTGRPSVETAARSVRLSVAAYLTKPPDLDELCALLDQAISDHRGFRAIRTGRERLHEWEQELERIETMLRKAPASCPGGPMSNYLRLSLRHVILILSDLERSTESMEQSGAGALEKLDHVAALRRTVQVLERTRQKFKSKDLADLRHQIEELLARNESATTG